MGLIPALIDFVPDTLILSAEVDSNFANIRDTVNGTGAFKDLANTFTAAQTFSSNVTIGGTLGVTGTTTLGNVTVSGTLGVATVSVTGNITVGGTLDVTGVATLTTLALSGATTGDLPYVDTAGGPGRVVRLPIGTAGHVLTVVSGKPAWAAAPGGGGGDVFLANTQTFTGVNTFSNDTIIGNGKKIKQAANTDGLEIWGGNASTGAVLYLYGNTHPDFPGAVYLYGGAAGNMYVFSSQQLSLTASVGKLFLSGDITEFWNGGSTTLRGSITSGGVFAWAGDATIGGMQFDGTNRRITNNVNTASLVLMGGPADPSAGGNIVLHGSALAGLPGGVVIDTATATGLVRLLAFDSIEFYTGNPRVLRTTINSTGGVTVANTLVVPTLVTGGINRGADSDTLSVAGGSGPGSSSGATIYLCGLTHATTPGHIYIDGGNVAGVKIVFRSGAGTVRGEILDTGVWDLKGHVQLNGNGLYGHTSAEGSPYLLYDGTNDRWAFGDATNHKLYIKANRNVEVPGTLTLAGLTAVGDVPYVDVASGPLAKLAIGSTGQVLTVASGKPSWAASPAGLKFLGRKKLGSTGATLGPIVFPAGMTRVQGTIYVTVAGTGHPRLLLGGASIDTSTNYGSSVNRSNSTSVTNMGSTRGVGLWDVVVTFGEHVMFQFDIFKPSSSQYARVVWIATGITNDPGTPPVIANGGAIWFNTADLIQRLELHAYSNTTGTTDGTMDAGSEIILYGSVEAET